MPEGEETAEVDIDFAFIAAFLDCAIGREDNAAFKTVHIMYSDIVNRLQYTKPKRKNGRVGAVVTV